MTEKQYSLVYHSDKGGAFIKNNETGNEWYHDSRASLLDVVAELNGLIEKNKVLYKEIERLRTQNKDLLYSNAKNMELLEKENEQLKSKLEKSKKAHSNCDKLWWELHDEKEQLEKENEQLKKKVKTLEDTIEGLTGTIAHYDLEEVL